MEQIERIQYMEDILRRGRTVCDMLEDALEALEGLYPTLKELSAYYESKLWLFDFDCDQQGLLPADMRRGVLSEDAIYDLLSDYDRLRGQMRALAARELEPGEGV